MPISLISYYLKCNQFGKWKINVTATLRNAPSGKRAGALIDERLLINDYFTIDRARSSFSLKRSSERRIFDNYRFAILSSQIRPNRKTLEQVICSGGGRLLPQMPSIKSLKQLRKLREDDPKSCRPGKYRPHRNAFPLYFQFS